MIWILLLVTVASASNSGHQLNYHDQSHWDPGCLKGRGQSPIDVPVPSTKEVVDGDFLVVPGSIEMDNINNANTAKYEVTPNVKVNVPWAGDRQITLVQLHVHWGAKTDKHGSEHLINGKGYAAESHLVTSYTDQDGSTKYMVFARLFEIGDANKQLGQMIFGEEHEGGKRNIKEFDLAALYPADASEWLTYHGGLTTPGCDEIVDWVIVKQPLTVSMKQLKNLRHMHLGHEDQPAMNANWRDTQPTNGRESKLYTRD